MSDDTLLAEISGELHDLAAKRRAALELLDEIGQEERRIHRRLARYLDEVTAAERAPLKLVRR